MECDTGLNYRRDVFSFSIVGISWQDSNMTTCIVYATAGSAILHFARTTSSKRSFRLIAALLTKLHKQGCQNTQIKRLLNKVLGKHFETFKKFAGTENLSFNCFDCFNLSCGFLLIKY